MIYNPYRKIIVHKDKQAICDFSELIPAWKLQKDFDFSNESLLSQCIDFAESRNYFCFYSCVTQSKLDLYMDQISFINNRYFTVVEEKVPSSSKSVNLLYWDWLMLTYCDDEPRCIIKHILKQEYRDKSLGLSDTGKQ